MRRVLRFGCVGTLGFLTDTSVLLSLINIGHLNPVGAKALSFVVAVLVTYELNRRWAFGDVSRSRSLASLATYLAVQSVGFLCNWAVFTASYMFLPASFNHVLVDALLASGAAMIVNYVGATRLVFLRPVRGISGDVDFPLPGGSSDARSS